MDNRHVGTVICVLCAVFGVLLCWEVVRERRRIITEEAANGVSCTPPPPAAGLSGVMTYGMRNWKTVQDMLHWKSEATKLDGVIADLDGNSPPPPPPPDRRWQPPQPM